MSANAKNVKALKECVGPVSMLGFTALEALVYAYLVQQSPATGYGVAKGIGKPIANTYKAIESLQRKGAVLVDQGGNGLCRAVPPDEVLEQVERTFRERHAAARRALNRLPLAQHDDGVYGLTSWEQVVDRCRRMLGRARAVALVDVFPSPLTEVAADVERCAARGVLVGVQVYGDATLGGVETVHHAMTETVLEKWPGHWLNCVIDGAELLIAYMAGRDEPVHQAIWSRSPFLCSVYQSALGAELLASQLQHGFREHWPDAQLRDTIARFSRFRAHELPAYHELTAAPDLHHGVPDTAS